MDETWLYHYDPETRQQSMKWWQSGSPRPKKIQVQKSAGKVLTLIFWDQFGIILIDYLPKRQTINAEYYSSLLVQLKDILKEKRRGKFTKMALFLYNNVPVHQALATQKKLSYLGFYRLDHPSYSPDLVPSDYHLIPGSQWRNSESRYEIRNAGGLWYFWVSRRLAMPCYKANQGVGVHVIWKLKCTKNSYVMPDLCHNRDLSVCWTCVIQVVKFIVINDYLKSVTLATNSIFIHCVALIYFTNCCFMT